MCANSCVCYRCGCPDRCPPVWTPCVWLSRQVPSSLDPLCKYTSRFKVWGTAYVDREKQDIDLPTAEQFYQKLLQLEKHIREKYREVRSKIRG
ncbi:HSD17B7 [Branchiostoma lanceolatum]|uniref:HSD17B7 protein n=1 Tax=Branchiostoma lanceolatum TaxID=7740 RepID=A0A8J9VWG2_BRALA|nr:HSD17B7 [Branchiostoma lanceolatum]